MNLPELLALIEKYDFWVYGVLLAYCLGKTGPLPMLAGFAAAQGALQWDLLFAVTLLGSIAGGQLRFAIGRFGAPWICRTFPKLAPWIALASAGVERYSLRVLLAYRFVKGAFSLVGLGAGASLLAWKKHILLDCSGSFIWISTMIGIGWAFGKLGAALDPRWAAYVGLALLVMSIVFLALVGKKIKAHLLPLAEQILQERMVAKNNSKSA
jgi:membrane-associated protein